MCIGSIGLSSLSEIFHNSSLPHIMYTESNDNDLYCIDCLYFQFLRQRTPLHVAVEEGEECTVESLVENFKADINSKDSDGVSKGPAFTHCL